MSQTYHSLLSFWKQFHVASLLEKKYCPCSFPPPVALRRFAALPSLGSGRDGVADRAGFTSLIGWQLTSVTTGHTASFATPMQNVQQKCSLKFAECTAPAHVHTPATKLNTKQDVQCHQNYLFRRLCDSHSILQ